MRAREICLSCGQDGGNRSLLTHKLLDVLLPRVLELVGFGWNLGSWVYRDVLDGCVGRNPTLDRNVGSSHHHTVVKQKALAFPIYPTSTCGNALPSRMSLSLDRMYPGSPHIQQEVFLARISIALSNTMTKATWEGNGFVGLLCHIIVHY